MNHRFLYCTVGLVADAVAWGLLVTQAAAAGPPQMRYGFEADQGYCYNVTIVGEIADRTLTQKGMLTYKCDKVTGSQFSLKTSGALKTSATGGSPSRFPPVHRFGGPRIAFGHTGGTTFSRTGTRISTKSEDYLPFVLGLKEVLVVEPLPEKPQADWTSETDIAVVERMATGPFFSSRFQSVTQTSGKEQIKYNILGQKDGAVRVRKFYSLKTLPDEGIVRFDMSGEGEFEFDTKRGVIRWLKMSYKIKANEKNLTMTIPVSLEYSVLSEAEMAQRKKEQEEAKAAEEEAKKPRPLERGEEETLVFKLRSGNDKEIAAAATRLVHAPPAGKRTNIGRTLIAAMQTARSPSTKATIAQALGVWRIPEAEGAMIAALSDKHVAFFGDDALAVLANFRSPAAAKVAAGSLTNPHLRSAAGDALAAMGPVAEEFVLPLLNDRDHWVHKEACKVLGKVGGQKSLQALKEQLVNTRNLSETHDLRDAIDAINRRGGQPPVMPPLEEDVVAKEKPARPARPAKAAGPASDAVSRTWQDITRSFQVEARFVSYANGKVTLLRADGRTITLPLDKLCEEDQKFVKDRAKVKNPFE